jgi:hypothetical protein
MAATLRQVMGWVNRRKPLQDHYFTTPVSCLETILAKKDRTRCAASQQGGVGASANKSPHDPIAAWQKSLKIVCWGK